MVRAYYSLFFRNELLMTKDGLLHPKGRNEGNKEDIPLCF